MRKKIERPWEPQMQSRQEEIRRHYLDNAAEPERSEDGARVQESLASATFAPSVR